MSHWSEGTYDEESFTWSCDHCGEEYDQDHGSDIDSHVESHYDDSGNLTLGILDEDFLEPVGYQMVMRFVLTKDNGGPYDPEAFTSGWNLGMIDALLGAARAIRSVPEPQTIRPIECEQIVMLAMKHGLLVAFQPHTPEWTIASFSLPAEEFPDMS